MKITASQTDGVSSIKIEGDLVIGGVAEAKPELVAVLAQGGDVFLDLSEVGGCDTAGIQLLLMARISAKSRGGKISVIAQSPSFRTALERVGISARCFEDEEGTH
ncbi:STAS domain-containing protein [Telmatospirillum sp.]|uniref:STAS domain-containing protein n=1 Tax=Telmatospirillum sp. TaxID=2079197 RepID=UPI00284F84B1|nr:STAS domain-containing protein [Telmatospirillum sp.]MDR3435216.1 STAS domain-containing protein [Telmatospirillum sp.]